MTSREPFNRVVKLAARAFYDNLSLKGDTQPKNFRGDNRGMAVVVLDALTRREWVQEEKLAKDLKLHSKQLRRILCFFEGEKLIMREHRKESPKGAKKHNAAATAASDGQPVTEREEKSKMHTYSYCCLDYAQICDVVRYRIHRMKKKLKDELDSRDTVQHYICPRCNKRYSAFDALQLLSDTYECFHCETCNVELVVANDKLVSEEMGAVNDNARKCRNDERQQRMDEQLKPLVAQLERVKKLPAPEFGGLKLWERTQKIANGGPGAAYSSCNVSPTVNVMNPEILVEVDVEGAAEDGKNDTDSKVMPVPPWMIGQGMNLTKQQRGEINSQSRLDEILETKDNNRHDSKDEIKHEYMKAYYKALMNREEEDAKRRMQYECETLVSDSQSERQVGKKYKREDQNEGIEGEEDQAAGNSAKIHKLADLSAEAQDSGNDEDDVEWEEG